MSAGVHASAAPFPPTFHDLLRQCLRRAPRLRGNPQREARGRRRALAASGTFAGHRAYVLGDDLRAVDWNAYARTGELFVKLLEEDDRRALTIVLDRTPSMATGEPLRWHGALRLAAILGGLALVRLDGLAVVAGSREVEVFAGAGAAGSLLRFLEDLTLGPQDPRECFGIVVERGWPGTVHWLSDFADPEAIGSGLRWLCGHGRRCTGWLPTVPEDVQPTARGLLRWGDPETGVEQVMEVDPRLCAAMAAELRWLARQQAAAFAAAGCPLVRFPLPASGDFRLASWLPQPWIYRL